MKVKPATQDEFSYSGDLFVQTSTKHQHKRATVSELEVHFSTKDGMDHPGHWYEAQLLHYGLPRSRVKSTAKMRLFDSVIKGRDKLTIPPHLGELEARLKQEWDKKVRRARRKRRERRRLREEAEAAAEGANGDAEEASSSINSAISAPKGRDVTLVIKSQEKVGSKAKNKGDGQAKKQNNHEGRDGGETAEQVQGLQSSEADAPTSGSANHPGMPASSVMTRQQQKKHQWFHKLYKWKEQQRQQKQQERQQQGQPPTVSTGTPRGPLNIPGRQYPPQGKRQSPQQMGAARGAPSQVSRPMQGQTSEPVRGQQSNMHQLPMRPNQWPPNQQLNQQQNHANQRPLPLPQQPLPPPPQPSYWSPQEYNNYSDSSSPMQPGPMNAEFRQQYYPCQ